MSQPTNTFDSFDSIGNREDLSDIIKLVEQETTPFISSIAGDVAVSGRFHEWQTDVLDSASAANAQIEGNEFPASAVTPSVRVGNRIQLSTKDFTISDLQNKMIDKAGRDREIANQIDLKTRAIKRDMEAALLANNTSVTGSSSTASEVGGLPSWLETNTSRGGGAGANGGFTGGNTVAATDGDTRAFTESLLKTVLKLGADSGAQFSHIMLGSFNKQKFSTFSGGATRQSDDTSKRIVNNIAFYNGDFGEQSVVYSPQQRDRDCLIVDKNLVNVGILNNGGLEVISIGRTGLTEKKMLSVYYTLEVLNEKGCGVVADLTTS